MKFNQTKLIAVTALAVVVAFSFFVNGSRAQLMGDMPYDLHFIDMMIMHHQEGLEMARMVDTKSKNARLKTFAQQLAVGSQKDIDELQGHRNHWYAGKPPMDHAAMQSMMRDMHPGMNMDMEDTRRKLLAAEGTAFDRLFLDTMIHHHQMAIGMAKEATAKAEHAEIKEFARKAAAKQTNQIAEMNRLKGVRTTATKTKPKPKPKPKTTTTTTTHKHGH